MDSPGGGAYRMTCAWCCHQGAPGETESQWPCPGCGREEAVSLVWVPDEPGKRGSLVVRNARPGYPGIVRSYLHRDKPSGRTRRPAHEVLVLDRSAREQSIKWHIVWELGDRGEWVIVHEHEEAFSAKRRPSAD
jgi:hypothetical protein